MIVDKEDEGKRLDKMLVEKFPQYSRTYFQYLIENHLVLVNGEPVKKRIAVKEGDEIEIEFALTAEISLEPQNIALDILYEDDQIIAVNKPPNMVVHPGAGNPKDTFVNALLFHCKNLPFGNTLRPGIVHRLDKETSGVLLAAKTEEAHNKLVALFASRQMKKQYVAICVGNPGDRTIEGNIGRHPTKRKEMAIVESGKEAITIVKKEASNNVLSYLCLYPQTGRTHQIRVHLQSVGAPILGDKIYGSESVNKKYKVGRQMLHAKSLEFNHPLSGQKMVIEAPIPEDFNKIYRTIIGA